MDRMIGKTGVKVVSIGLGAMPLSLQARPDEATAIKVLHAAWDHGTQFIDTADAYCLDDQDMGHNERLIAKALAGWDGRDKIRVATKGGCQRPGGDWTVNGDPAYLRRACESSLRNLKVKTIFLYQLHAPDHKYFEESVGELAKLQREGKILHIGISNVNLSQLRIAQGIARIESIQNRFNPFEKRDWENGLIRACEEEGLTFISHSPVGGHMGHLKRRDHPLLGELAQKYGVSTYCVMLRWHLQKSECILPIPGASKISSATDSLQALKFKLEAEDIERIEAVS
jgi:aryl-alcohol dehydrogenase-like predicted oxidoreductase